MNEKIFNLKKKLISAISAETYYGLINFAERIYNADYDVVILMARKASNLYAALLPLVREEYLGSIEEEHIAREQNVATIISDRAIEWVLSDIKRRKKETRFKRVLIADDIIIHGTTIAQIREKLKNVYADAGLLEEDYRIDIMAYAENIDGVALNAEDIYNIDTIVKCDSGSWKKVSNRIIELLHIMGRSYTSYVPTAVFEMNSLQGKSIKTLIDSGKAKEVWDKNKHRRNEKAYVVVASRQLEYEICETYRIYEYRQQQKYVFVPMVTVRPINEFIMKCYIELLLKYITPEAKAQIGEIAQSLETEYPYRLMIYILSAFAGLVFFERELGQKLDESIYDEKEEIMNFSCALLDRNVSRNEHKIPLQILIQINRVYKDLQTQMTCLKDEIIGEDVAELKDELRNAVHFVDNVPYAENHRVAGDIISKIMEANNRLDEGKFDHWKSEKRKEVRVRMKGIPVACIYSELGHISNSIEENSSAIVHVIDTGKGSIVPLIVNCKNQKIFISMLRAGEQNFKYYTDNYLPIMYGFYIIETMGMDKMTQKECKIRLWNAYYKDSEMPLFGQEDKNYLINCISMDKEFGDIIVEEVLCEDNPEIVKVNKLINSYTAG